MEKNPRSESLIEVHKEDQADGSYNVILPLRSYNNARLSEKTVLDGDNKSSVFITADSFNFCF